MATTGPVCRLSDDASALPKAAMVTTSEDAIREFGAFDLVTKRSIFNQVKAQQLPRAGGPVMLTPPHDGSCPADVGAEAPGRTARLDWNAAVFTDAVGARSATAGGGGVDELVYCGPRYWRHWRCCVLYRACSQLFEQTQDTLVALQPDVPIAAAAMVACVFAGILTEFGPACGYPQCGKRAYGGSEPPRSFPGPA